MLGDPQTLICDNFLLSEPVDPTEQIGGGEDDTVWTCEHCGHHHALLADQAFPNSCSKCGISSGVVAI